MINKIFFDLDGTISDSSPGIIKSAQYALESFGIKVEDEDVKEFRKFIGSPLRQILKDFSNFDDDKVEEVVEKFRERYLPIGIFENIMYDGIDTMLQGLYDSGKTLIIATSKPHIQAHTVLSHFNLDKYFTFVSGAEMDGTRSSKAEVIQHALEQCNITDISTCIMIGDRKHDIIGAKNVGMKSIGVLFGYGDYHELSEAGADYIVKDVDELTALLLTLCENKKPL